MVQTSYFNPISQFERDFNTPVGINKYRIPHAFTDARLGVSFEQYKEQTERYQSVVIRQVAESTAQSKRFYGLLNNPKVSVAEIMRRNCQIDPALLQYKEVICIGDSTSFNMKAQKNTVKNYDKFGVLNDGKTAGFNAHASLALDASDGTVIGLTDALIWNRPKERANFKTETKQDLESYKWHLGAQNSHRVLSAAQSVNFVFDREADDYDLMQYITQTLENDLTVRLKTDRKILHEGKIRKVSECLNDLSVALVYQFTLRALNHYSWTSGKRIKRKERIVNAKIKYTRVNICKPGYISKKAGLNIETLEFTIIEVTEEPSNLPDGEKPLNWMIWTSKDIQSVEEALQIIQIYQWRWTIEQLFRTMKKEGFKQESTELGDADAIMKQTAITFNAAAKVMQLVNARDKEETPPIETVFEEQEQEVLHKINERLEGKTEKLKNPHSPDCLSYAAWIIGRLGGWKGYKSQRPAGPLTMKRGLDKFYNLVEGYALGSSG